MNKKSVLVFRHVKHEGLGTLADALSRAGLTFHYRDIVKNPLPLPSPAAIAGLIVLGGPMGVYEGDQYPFLRKETAYIKRVLSAKKPLLGICLGAQLIAQALGARVFPGPHKEFGWHRVQLTPEGKRDPFFKESPPTPWVFQWHGDTFTLPKGAELLATGPRCRHQAFRYGSGVYGLQFHLEVNKTMIQEWLVQPGVKTALALHRKNNVAPMTMGPRSPLARLPRVADPAFNFFARLCQN